MILAELHPRKSTDLDEYVAIACLNTPKLVCIMEVILLDFGKIRLISSLNGPSLTTRVVVLGMFFLRRITDTLCRGVKLTKYN